MLCTYCTYVGTAIMTLLYDNIAEFTAVASAGGKNKELFYGFLDLPFLLNVSKILIPVHH